MEERGELLKQKSLKIQKEVKQKTLGYILAALGLVAGLAWNDAIKSLINELFPIEKNGVFAHFLYAILVTLAVIIVASYLTRYLKSSEE